MKLRSLSAMKEDLVIRVNDKIKFMNKALLIPVIIVSLISFFVSCRSAKKIQKAITNTKRDTTSVINAQAHDDSVSFIKETFQQLEKQKIDFNTFQAKISVRYVGRDENEQKATAFVRMYRDSAIWISIRATIFDYEALRVYITKDSVKLLDKPNKTYTSRSVAYLQEMTDLPLDLITLQQLIIGNPVFLDSNIVSYSRSPNSISLFSIGDRFKNLITLSENDKLMLHSKLDDADINRSRTCDLNYTGYDNKNGVNFSTERSINVAEKSKLGIWLEFKDYKFNETLSFPFEVPKNYKWN